MSGGGVVVNLASFMWQSHTARQRSFSSSAILKPYALAMGLSVIRVKRSLSFLSSSLERLVSWGVAGGKSLGYTDGSWR